MVKCMFCPKRLGSPFFWTLLEPITNVPHYVCESCMDKRFNTKRDDGL